MPLLNTDYCYLNADGTLKKEHSEKQQSKKTKKALIPKFLVFREGLTEVCIWAKTLNKSNGMIIEFKIFNVYCNGYLVV